MTDPSVPPPASAEDKPKFQTIADLEKELLRRAHISPDDDYQALERFNYDTQTIVVGKPNPFNSDFVVFAAFQDADEVRAYEVPHKDAQPKEGGQPPPRPRRLTFPKNSGRMGPISEIMSFDRLVTLVAEETSVLVNEVQTFMMERLKVVEFLRSIHPATSVPTIIQAITEGKHAPDEDEDEDDETGDQVAQAVANGAAPK